LEFIRFKLSERQIDVISKWTIMPEMTGERGRSQKGKTMIKHIVMWKLKEHAEGCGKLENAQKLKSWLESLADKIAELKFVEVGINFDHSDAAFDVVLYTEFENKEALKSYQAHPEHRRLIKEFLDKIRLEKKVVDYEV